MSQEMEETTQSMLAATVKAIEASSSQLDPPQRTVLIPGTHLPESAANSSSNSNSQPSPMSVEAEATTPVATSSTASGEKEEKVGRWSDPEHQIFLQGLERYGKQWKTIATMIGTRTVVQVRTHAQKYFQKLERKNKDHSSSTTAASMVGIPRSSSSLRASSARAGGKRKSLLGASPSTRKKSRAAAAKKTAVQVPVMPLTSVSPPPLELQNYMSNASLSSENLSTISPSGVAELDLGMSLTKEDSATDPEGLVLVPTGDDLAGQDPLEWLMDGGINHLPESSLEQAPMFPDFSELSSDHHLSLPQQSSAVKSSNFDTSFLPDIPDPKVTVQSLFLENNLSLP